VDHPAVIRINRINQQVVLVVSLDTNQVRLSNSSSQDSPHLDNNNSLVVHLVNLLPAPQAQAFPLGNSSNQARPAHLVDLGNHHLVHNRLPPHLGALVSLAPPQHPPHHLVNHPPQAQQDSALLPLPPLNPHLEVHLVNQGEQEPCPLVVPPHNHHPPRHPSLATHNQVLCLVQARSLPPPHLGESLLNKVALLEHPSHPPSPPPLLQFVLALVHLVESHPLLNLLPQRLHSVVLSVLPPNNNKHQQEVSLVQPHLGLNLLPH
jgi:hypothetical protein